MQSNNENMASASQINYLRNLGYQGPENITAGEASDIIKRLIQNKNAAGGQQPQQPIYNNYGQQQAAPNQSAAYQQPAATPQQFNKNDVAALQQLGITDDLMNNLNELAGDGRLFIPENYSVGNALKSAMSKILTSDQCEKLLACTEESKRQALTEYVVQGLDASKTQAYFIPYGNKMTMMRSYFGDVLVAKRTGLIKDVYAIVIYQGDEIEIGFDEYGRKTLIKHVTKFENQDNEIIGAYAVAVGINDYKYYEFMTRKELEASWKMTKMPNGKLHTDYKQEAAKRTVIRRLVKMIFNTSLNTTEEQTELIASYTRTTEDEYIDSDVTTETVNEEQKNKTGKKQLKVETTPDPDGWPE